MKAQQTIDFAQRWLAFLQRKVLLSRGLGFPMGQSIDPTKSGFLQCKAVDEVISSLVFIDLMSLFDDAMATQIGLDKFSKLKTLHNRIEYLDKQGKLLDSKAIHDLRTLRNEVAHRVKRITIHQLDAAVAAILSEFLAWGLVKETPNYIRFIDRDRDYQERVTEGTLRFVRKYTVGVCIAETHDPVLAYDIDEYVDSNDNPTSSMRVERKRNF